MKKPDESNEEYRERVIAHNKEHWMYIGEVEELKKETSYRSINSVIECSDAPNNYLFRHRKNNCMYSIAPSYYKVGFVNPVVIDMEISAITFLVMLISCDMEYGRNMIKPCFRNKIRLKGMTEWLEYNDDYLHYKINLKELDRIYSTINE